MRVFRFFSVVLLIIPALLAPFAVRAEDPKKDAQEPAISVDVKLVNVFVTVTDASGAPARTLTKDHFALFEDGVPQAISVFNRESQLPLSIVMAVDASLSTKKDLKLELVSARKFAHEIMRPQDALALYQFSEIVEELVPFTADLKRIDAGIERVHVLTETSGSSSREAR